MKYAYLLAALTMTGCTTVRPIFEYTHVSHAAQHVDKGTNYGTDMMGVGVRIRPMPGVTVDLIESYALQPLHGQREVFTGRVNVEF